MSYGFNVYNDDGSVQISTDFINYYFVGKGTYTVPTDITSRGAISIETGVLHDVAAVACDTWYVRGGTIKTSPSTTVSVTPDAGPRYGSLPAPQVVGAPAGTQFHYWLFRAYSSLTPSTTDVGLEVYNSAGQVAFSSRFPKIMRTLPPVPILSLPGKTDTLPGDLYTLPQGGREYAFVSYGVFRRWYVEPGVRQEPFDFAYLHTMKRVPQGFYMALQDTRSGRTSYEGDIYEGGILPIDVTGY